MMKSKKVNQQIAKSGMRAGALYGCLSYFLCYIHLWIYVCSGICWKKEGVRAPLGASKQLWMVDSKTSSNLPCTAHGTYKLIPAL